MMRTLAFVAGFPVAVYGGSGAVSYPYVDDTWGGVCKTGTAQSPIALPQCTAGNSKRAELAASYGSHDAELSHTGHAVKISLKTPTDAIKFVSPTGTYKLVQCHWHDDSEHTIDGKKYPLCAHCVHEKIGDSSRYGVLGVVYEVDSTVEDPFLKSIVDNLPVKTDTTTKIDKAGVNFTNYLAGMTNLSNYYTYAGSLTTPPCTEAVDWHVLSHPVKLTQAQLDKMVAALGHSATGTFRPPQPLNGRVVLGCAAVTTGTTANNSTNSSSTASNTSSNANSNTTSSNTSSGNNTTTAAQASNAVAAAPAVAAVVALLVPALF